MLVTAAVTVRFRASVARERPDCGRPVATLSAVRKSDTLVSTCICTVSGKEVPLYLEWLYNFSKCRLFQMPTDVQNFFAPTDL